MKKILFLCGVGVLLSASAYASCYTGFACSIDSLEREENKKISEYMEIMDKYFSKHPVEKNYSKGKILITNYKDIFLFNTVV